MNAATDLVTVWIDDEATCDATYQRDGLAHPVCRGGLHHLYFDEFDRRWAMRCPLSLSKEEQERVFWDDPPGSAKASVLEYRRLLKSQRRGGGRREENGV